MKIVERTRKGAIIVKPVSEGFTKKRSPQSVTVEQLLQAIKNKDVWLNRSKANHFLINDTTVVKIGETVTLKEVAAINFVRRKTTIPVPQVREAYFDSDTGLTLIIMDRVQGIRLVDHWDDYTFRTVEKHDIIAQLGAFWSQLRTVGGTFIGSVDGTACEHERFFHSPENPSFYGPFNQNPEASFNWVMGYTVVSQTITRPDPFGVFRRLQDLRNHRIMLSHGNLHPRNIIVQGLTVVAILDWGHSGFYPEYWDWCRALRQENIGQTWTRVWAINRIIGWEYPRELDVLKDIGIQPKYQAPLLPPPSSQW